MNFSEKIAGAYLRLNGFFLLPHFTLFDGANHTHVDFLVLRPPKGREKVKEMELLLDKELFSQIDKSCGTDSKDLLLGGVVEVKGGDEKETPSEAHLAYAKDFLGPDAKVVLFSFFHGAGDIKTVDGTITITVEHALNWVLERIKWMNKNIHRLTKSGSWTWSEAFLSDLLYIHRLDLLSKIAKNKKDR